MIWRRRNSTDLCALIADLKTCSSSGNLERGKGIHATAIQTGDASNVFIANTLIDMYAKCGSMKDARAVFDGIQNRSVVSWNSLILGYADNGKSDLALKMFTRMEAEESLPDERTFVAALKACSTFSMRCRPIGQALHLLACSTGCDSNTYVENSLVNMYAKSGSMDEGRRIFENMQSRTVVSWNALLLGYADHGEGETALRLFARRGCVPDDRTYVAVLKACTVLAVKSLNPELCTIGKTIHILASMGGYDSDTYVANTLVDMYATCKSMEEARNMFEGMRYRDVVTWTTLIMGHADNGLSEVALSYFSRMEPEGYIPDEITFVAALKACTEFPTDERRIEAGRAMHLLASENGCDSYINVRNTLLDLYVKSGVVEDAQKVFDDMLYRDVVSWTVLMLGYAESGDGSLALELFVRMKREGCQPDALTFTAALKACGILGALEFGKSVHGEICGRGGYKDDHVLANCLIDFYAKCGSLIEAERLFESHVSKDIVTWNSLMAGYSRHGNTQAVFDLFERMQSDSGVHPNHVTFLSVLMACSHAGHVDKGKHFFELMIKNYALEADVEHYTCMTDLLGRANKLDEAMVFLRRMPFFSDTVSWMTILGACRKWKNVNLARLAFESLTSLDDNLKEGNSGHYILMANIYGSKGMWDDRAKVLAMKAKLRISKKPGRSLWTNAAGKVHMFTAGDTSHPQSQEIHEKFKELVVKMKEQHGYVADLSSITKNLSDVEKEDALCGHSEKLAIAYALLNTRLGETIRIIKNLRVCDDCHTVAGLISKIEERTILCRDSNRFHVFRNGACSCGDFW